VIVTKVLHSFTTTDPLLVVFFLIFHRVTTGQHPIVKKGIGFPKVHYVQFDTLVGWRIGDAKVEPLSVAFGVNIVL
jgi:hypothetical protein